MKEAREYVDHHYAHIQGSQQRQSTGVWIVAKFSVRDYSVYIYLLIGPLHLPSLALTSRSAPDVASGATLTWRLPSDSTYHFVTFSILRLKETADLRTAVRISLWGITGGEGRATGLRWGEPGGPWRRRALPIPWTCEPADMSPFMGRSVGCA